jgi:hypothetical protein
MFWGSGIKELNWPLPDGRHLIVRWQYSHLFWCNIAHDIHWYIISDKRSEDKEIPYDEVVKMFPIKTPHISHWEKYGGYYAIIIFLLIGISQSNILN